jgi:hypothetical protein
MPLHRYEQFNARTLLQAMNVKQISCSTPHTHTKYCYVSPNITTRTYPCRKTCVGWHQRARIAVKSTHQKKIQCRQTSRKKGTNFWLPYRDRYVSLRGYGVAISRLPPPPAPPHPKRVVGHTKGNDAGTNRRQRKHLIKQSADLVGKMTLSLSVLRCTELCNATLGEVFNTKQHNTPTWTNILTR